MKLTPAATGAVILAMDFAWAPSNDPAVLAATRALAESIAADTPGLLWKIWTRDAARGRAGGLYAFADRPSALAYQAMHTARVEARGAADIQAALWDTNPDMGAITRAPL